MLMKKSIPQEGNRSADMIEDNLKFANLWNKINVKIASKLKKTTKEEMGKLPVYGKTPSQVPLGKTLHPHRIWKLIAAH